MGYGVWSRLIAETGEYHHAVADAVYLQRPLFYAVQGYLWNVLGEVEAIGRLYSFGFAIVLGICVWVLAGRLTSRIGDARLHAPLALTVLLGSGIVAAQAASGLTDVPVAAMTALTAVFLTARPGRARFVLVALAAAGAVLAKPTGLMGLAGLALAAVLLGSEPKRRRPAFHGLIAMAIGVSGALAYDGYAARSLGITLADLLRAGGDTDWYVSLAADERWDALLGAGWLGEESSAAIVLGLVFGAARAACLAPRWAAALAGPSALAWSLAGPLVASDQLPYPLRDAPNIALIAYSALSLALLAAPFFARVDPVDPRVYRALLLWIAPGAAVWLAYRADEPRLLSPAWTPLVLLAASALVVVALGLARLVQPAALLPVVATGLLALTTLPSIDGRGLDGWKELLAAGPSGWSNRSEMENAVWGPFQAEVELLRANVRANEHIATNDGKLLYVFPGQTEVVYARSCAELRGARAFVLLTDDENHALITQRYHGTPDPLSWAQCREPRLTQIGDYPGIYSVFLVDGTSRQAEQPSDCRVFPTEGTLDDAVFVDGVSYASARAVLARAAAVGYPAVIERTGCRTFRVVVRGVPQTDANRAEFRGESSRAGFDVRFAAGMRYPEVAADVPPPPGPRESGIAP
jgi:hypothetical protein